MADFVPCDRLLQKGLLVICASLVLLGRKLSSALNRVRQLRVLYSARDFSSPAFPQFDPQTAILDLILQCPQILA